MPRLGLFHVLVVFWAAHTLEHTIFWFLSNFLIWIQQWFLFLSPDSFSLIVKYISYMIQIYTLSNYVILLFISGWQAQYRILCEKGRCINTFVIMLNGFVTCVPKSGLSEHCNVAAFINLAVAEKFQQKHDFS